MLVQGQLVHCMPGQVQTWPSDAVAVHTLRLVTENLSADQQKLLKVTHT